jgi:hypothetical protein
MPSGGDQCPIACDCTPFCQTLFEIMQVEINTPAEATTPNQSLVMFLPGLPMTYVKIAVNSGMKMGTTSHTEASNPTPAIDACEMSIIV